MNCLSLLTRLAFGSAVIVALQACSIEKLGQDVERAQDSYGYIAVTAPPESQFGGHIRIALYSITSEGRKLVALRSIAPGASAAFLVPVAAYELVAFEDANDDFVYQPGEAAQLIVAPALITTADLSDDGYIYDEFTAQPLSLSDDQKIDFEVDLSLQSM